MNPPAPSRALGHSLTLRSTQLFSGLPEADLAVLAALVQPRQLARDAYLFREGAEAEGFYVVQKGAINVHRVNAEGREQVIQVFRPGDSFAEATLASAHGYPADARAVEDSIVLLLPKKPILQLLARQPELALRMLGSMSQHLRVLVGLLDDLTLKDVETRLAHWLVRHLPPAVTAGPYLLPLGRTKRTLAAELGTTAETLSRTLARLRQQKLVVGAGRNLTLLDPEGLRRFLRHQLGERD